MRALLALTACLACAGSAFASPRSVDHGSRDLEAFRGYARQCFTELGSEASGDLVVRVELGFNGLIAIAEVESRDFSDEHLVACVMSAFLDRSLFRHDEGGVHSDYLKFRFRRGSPAGLLFIGSGDALVSTELPEQAISRVTAGALDPLRWCWRSELRAKPGLSVDLDARFLIGESGLVHWASAGPRAGSPGLPGLETCAVTALRSMRFPRPRPYRVAQVDFPLDLRPDGSVNPAASGQRFDLREQPGILSVAAIDRAVDPALEAIEGCYRLALRRNPEVAGRVEVEFLIETDGRTEYVSATPDPGATSSTFLESCLIEVFEGLEFPYPNGGGVVQVRYPFRFERPTARIARPH